MALNSIRLVVTGGRDFDDRDWAYFMLDRINDLYEIEVLIHGGARGADNICGEWAIEKGIEVIVEKADWNRHGNSAGPIRNQLMIDKHKPDYCFACPGGVGTAHMKRRCRAANISIFGVDHT